MTQRLRTVAAMEVDLPPLITVDRDPMVEAPVGAPLPAEPWTRAHLLGLVAVHLLAAVGLAGAWFGLSEELVFTKQIPHLDLALVATMAGGAVNLLWIAHGRRSVANRKAAFLRRVAAVLPETTTGRAGDLTVSGARASFVTADRMTRYHRPDCPLLDGKIVGPVTYRAPADRRPCGVCLPTTDTDSAMEAQR